MRSFGFRLLLNHYIIVLTPALKIYFFLPFVTRLITSFSCRTVAKLLYNCSFLYFKALLLSSILFHVSCGIFLVELLLNYYKIVLSSTLKLYFFLQFCFTFHAVFFLWNCCYIIIKLFFPCFKALLLSSICLTSH